MNLKFVIFWSEFKKRNQKKTIGQAGNSDQERAIDLFKQI